VPPMLPPERWALTPPFHPYRAASPSAIRLRGLLSGRLKVFLQMATEARCTGGLFSVALSVAENLASLARSAPGAGCTCSPPRQSSDPLALPGALPLWSLPRRATNFHPQQQARRPRCPDFPPGRLPCESRPSVGIYVCSSSILQGRTLRVHRTRSDRQRQRSTNRPGFFSKRRRRWHPLRDSSAREPDLTTELRPLRQSSQDRGSVS